MSGKLDLLPGQSPDDDDDVGGGGRKRWSWASETERIDHHSFGTSGHVALSIKNGKTIET